jgi:probable addiction module antidote protein
MPARNWRDYLVQRLKDHPDEVPAYLNACLAEDGATFLTGLKTVVQAKYGGSQGLARDTGLHRVSIQNMLTERGNPRLHSLESILKALGLQLSVRDEAIAHQIVKRRKPAARPRRASA